LASDARRRAAIFAVAWRAPLLIWQGSFFIGALGFLTVMSFWLVKNYRMEPAFVFQNWERILARPFFWDAFWRTLGLASLGTLVISVLAFPAAYTIGLVLSPRAQRLAIFLLVIPFFTSYLVRAYAWQIILADRGILNFLLSWLGIPAVSMLNTPAATLVGYATLTLPLVVVLQALSISSIDRRLIEAAYNLGCTRLRAISMAIVPLARSGLIIAAVFAFILCYGDFVAPYYLGGSLPPTLSILIVDTAKSGQQWPRSAVVAITMIGVLMAVSFVAMRLVYGRRR